MALFMGVITLFAMSFTVTWLYIVFDPALFWEVLSVGLGISFTLTMLITFFVAIGARRFNRLTEDVKRMNARQALHDAEIQAALRREKDEAEAANVMKNRFLARMSHELKTPMNGVLGLAALMEASPLPAEARERMALLKASGHEMLALIEDLLDTSMIEAGVVRLDPQPTDVPTLLAEVVGRFEAAARRAGVTIDIAADSGFAARCVLDGRRLRQIVSNFVGNAIKYAPDGPVLVRVGWAGPARIRLTVEDRGAGVPAPMRERIFERFVQIEDGEDRRAGGVGLGLSVCRDLARMMGGAVGVAPATPRGSLFWFEAPVAPVDLEDAGELVA